MNKSLLSSAIAAVTLFSCQQLSAQTPEQSEKELIEEMVIVGIRENRTSRGATGMNLSLFDTPQSVSVLEASTIENFGLDDVNTMLEFVTGVNVEETETDRTYYNARGFDITTMNVDGVGVPFGELVEGAIDTAMYEKTEVIRGANGLITGFGNPSGTINYVRKRPTNNLQASVQVTGGSWDKQRLELDASTPLTESGSWAARAVIAAEKKDSWLDLYENERQLYYGVIDGQLTDRITLTAGASRLDNRSNGVLWGALPLLDANGDQMDVDESTTVSMDWTYWDVLTDNAFVEVNVDLTNDWRLTASYNYTHSEDHEEAFYVYTETGIDPNTGLGILSNPGKFSTDYDIHQWEARLAGSFELFGLTHEASLGVSLADKDSEDYEWIAQAGFQNMPAFPGWSANEVARPTWDAPSLAGEGDMQLNRLYGALRLSLSDSLRLILGFNALDYENRGVSWGVSTDSDEDSTNPYIGFTWALFPNTNLYASYSELDNPQYYLNENLQPLGSAEGSSYEMGMKNSWYDSRLITSVALFKSEQDNLGEFMYYTENFTWSIYQGISVESTGIELEVGGQVTDSLKVSAGYTWMELEDPNGDDTRTHIPRNSLKLLAEWTPEFEPKLELGVSTRWQDDIYNDTGAGVLRQDAYAIVGAYANYQLTENLSLSANANNIFDEKYLSSIMYEQSYYGAPRNFTASVKWKL